VYNRVKVKAVAESVAAHRKIQNTTVAGGARATECEADTDESRQVTEEQKVGENGWQMKLGCCGIGRGSHVKVVLAKIMALSNLFLLSFPFVPMKAIRVALRRIPTRLANRRRNGRAILPWVPLVLVYKKLCLGSGYWAVSVSSCLPEAVSRIG
jgi:hypothetical protein